MGCLYIMPVSCRVLTLPVRVGGTELRPVNESYFYQMGYTTFEKALTKVLQVSHEEMQRRLKNAKQERKQQRKRTSGHVSREKD